MTDLAEALVRVQTDLRALRRRWALIGGIAISMRSEPRTTNDVDLVVVVESDSEAEEIVRTLRGWGYQDLSAGALLEQKDVGRIAGIRLLSPSGDPLGVGVDLLFASSGIEPEIVAAAQVLEVFPGAYLPVATLGHLLALKVLAGRERDRIDIQSLLRVARKQDLEGAREALQWIERRGFHQGKNLLRDFAAFLSVGLS